MSALPEILAPCGSMESLTAALRAGADAVYLGGKRFSARKNAKNFSREELAEAVRLCRRYGAAVYQAINTIVSDSELEELASELEFAAALGVDGIIVQDLAVCRIAREAAPGLRLHASTQLSIGTLDGVEFAKAAGFSRVVLARELSLEGIRELSGAGIETEVFVHGALCMSVSGQCYLSAAIGGRSANRGLCAGACRLMFSPQGRPKNGQCALSLKDLSLIPHAEALRDAGVSSLKIEGRMKRPEYVAAAVDSLYKALRGESYDLEALRSVFSRSGFTDGYFTGKTGKAMFGVRSQEDERAAKDICPRLRELYRSERQRLAVDMELFAEPGSRVRLTVSSLGDSVTVTGEPVSEAKSRPTDSEEVKRQLTRLGGTVYLAGKISLRLLGSPYLSAAEINGLRRRALTELDEKRIGRLMRPIPFDRDRLSLAMPKTLNMKHPELIVRVERVSQLEYLDVKSLYGVIIPADGAKEYLDAGYPIEKATVYPPRGFDGDAALDTLTLAKGLGFKSAACSNPGELILCKRLGLEPVGGFTLNIKNSLCAWEYAKMGLKAETLSPELTAREASALSAPVPTGAVVYGRLPLMLTKNCPIKSELDCARCTRRLTDRTGSEFSVLCHKEYGWFELLNSRFIWLADRMRDFNLDFGVLYFTVESKGEVKRVYDGYINRLPPSGGFTRGLYYRGVE